MITNSVPSDFWGYFRRYLNRSVFSNFQNSGIDQFTVAPAANPNKFLQLTNVLPSVSGGFVRRWGLSPVSGGSVASVPQRMLFYQAKADSTFTGTQDTYLMLGANAGALSILLSEVNGTPSYSLPTQTATGSTLRGVTSRNWFYAAYGAARGQKIDFSQRSFNTESLWGIGGPISGTAPTGITGTTYNSTGGSSSTSATQSGSGTTTNGGTPIGFASQPVTGSVTITCNFSASLSWFQGGGAAEAQYSTNGGTTWTIFYAASSSGSTGTSNPSTSVSVTIGGVTNLNAITVRAFATASAGPSGNASMSSTVSSLIATVGAGGFVGTGAVPGETLSFTTVAGTGQYTTAPTAILSGGGGSGATILPNSTGTNVIFAAVTAGGTGYISPSVTFSGGGGTGAAADVVVSAGVITNIVITNPGSGYTSAPTITITDSAGTGAAATAVINIPFLVIESFTITNEGTGYTSPPTVIISSGGQLQAGQALAIINASGNVTNVVPQGPIMLVSGRSYSYTWGNSVTGHYGDILYTPATQSANSTTGQAGFTGIYVTLVAAVPDDPQINNVELLATSDGGAMTQLYGIANNTNVTSNTTFVWNYTDVLPDTVNQYYSTGPTLLTSNLWVDVNPEGIAIGVAGNQPPLSTLNCPVVNQGRMFMTDGLSVYFSKSIDEVTTSTGLITSKWEEAWPGTNVLNLLSDNEQIVGLLSANGAVYIGTTQNIIILTGSDATSFSAQIAFHNAGLLSPDLWTLIYKENIPIGMMWVTPDLKVLFSDFSSYQNVGLGIYPILQAVGTSALSVSSLQSIVFGPYAFVAMNYQSGSGPELLIYDTVGHGWYQWSGTNFGTASCPILAYTNFAGINNLYMTPSAAGSSVLTLFNAGQAFDSAILSYAQTNIPWTIQTTWQNLEDSTAYKVLNELEIWTNEPTTQVNVFAANTSSDYLSGGTSIKSGSLVTSPLHALKFYLAGVDSKARYYSFLFSCNTPGTNSQVLDQFMVEAYTMSRL